MKSTKAFLAFILINILLMSIANAGPQSDTTRLTASLADIDAYEALKIANEWREKNYDVKSSVDTEAVRFILPDKKRVSIPLPDDRMVVAIAPYINRTHR